MSQENRYKGIASTEITEEEELLILRDVELELCAVQYNDIKNVLDNYRDKWMKEHSNDFEKVTLEMMMDDKEFFSKLKSPEQRPEVLDEIEKRMGIALMPEELATKPDATLDYE